jgi:hypothetical protein
MVLKLLNAMQFINGIGVNDWYLNFMNAVEVNELFFSKNDRQSTKNKCQYSSYSAECSRYISPFSALAFIESHMFIQNLYKYAFIHPRTKLLILSLECWVLHITEVIVMLNTAGCVCPGVGKL